KKVLTTMKSSLEVIKINGLSYEYFLFKNDLDFFKNSLEEANTNINVLPGLDPYVMGYKNRERYLDKKFYEYVFDRSGNGTTTILINGSIVGVWDLIEKPKPSIKIYTFEKIAQDVFQAIKIECQKVSKFLTGKNLDIEKCSKMTSLTKRTMGGFMSPLKGC
ncbi:MAG: DNA glycosylase AlkZ-like family protein, partial [Candidatus Thorarchaeota archaeon]